MSEAQPLLELEAVTKHFPLRLGTTVRAVDGVSLKIWPGECLGLVGESGCGKSTLGRLVAQLLPLTSGRIYFAGQELSALPRRQLRRLRANLSMVFQDPIASLDPRMTIESIIAEPLRNFSPMPASARRCRVQELLDTVQLSTRFISRYPHELSGGQRQRVGIARALAVQPQLIVCDEPISALDVSIQGQIINLLEDLRRQFNLTYLFIAHDLAVVRHISDRVAVMYLGQIVESAGSEEIYAHPRHPYTKALLSAIPLPDPILERQRRAIPIEGEIPSPINPPSGCRFHPRCPLAELPGRCSELEPELVEKAASHLAACHFSEQVSGL
ncbi:MAG: ABC transporter ATP-binding protein [Candidatus Dormibacteraceae bacterium]